MNPSQILIETPSVISVELQDDLENLLQTEFQTHLDPGEKFSISARTGERAAWLEVKIGNSQKAHVFELFIQDATESSLEGGLDFLIDYLEGVLKIFFKEKKNAWLPLDFTKYIFEKQTIWAKHELKNFEAETLAETLLKNYN